MATKEKQQADDSKAATRDWVGEAVRTIVRPEVSATDPVAAIREYYDANASDELKARNRAEGKTPESCWEYVVEVAKEALKGKNGHLPPGVVYAVAMHYFEDVPVDWNGMARAAATERTNGGGKSAKDKKKPWERRRKKARVEKAAPADAEKAEKTKPARAVKAKAVSEQVMFDFGEEAAGGH